MERQWNKKVTIFWILKYLLKYKKQWFNHVTYLWGEPFIQPVFFDALKIGKKMWFTILVTTNATTIHLESQAKKYLPFIDELILSVEAIDKGLQQKISRTEVFVKWEEVFKNIKLYWRWSYLKVNIVITIDNLPELFNIVKYVVWKWVKDIAITYPDLDMEYYWKDSLLNSIAPTYKDCMKEIIKINELCDDKKINFKIVDFPFCVFPKDNIDKYLWKTDDFDYSNRIKVSDILYEDDKLYYWKISRDEILPREREHIKECKNCKYNSICWWPSKDYKHLYWYNEIKSII